MFLSKKESILTLFKKNHSFRRDHFPDVRKMVTSHNLFVANMLQGDFPPRRDKNREKMGPFS